MKFKFLLVKLAQHDDDWIRQRYRKIWATTGANFKFNSTRNSKSSICPCLRWQTMRGFGRLKVQIPAKSHGISFPDNWYYTWLLLNFLTAAPVHLPGPGQPSTVKFGVPQKLKNFDPVSQNPAKIGTIIAILFVCLLWSQLARTI